MTEKIFDLEKEAEEIAHDYLPGNDITSWRTDWRNLKQDIITLVNQVLSAERAKAKGLVKIIERFDERLVDHHEICFIQRAAKTFSNQCEICIQDNLFDDANKALTLYWKERKEV